MTDVMMRNILRERERVIAVSYTHLDVYKRQIYMQLLLTKCTKLNKYKFFEELSVIKPLIKKKL